MTKQEEMVEREVSLVEANAYADKTNRALAEKRDAVVAEMLKPYVEAYGEDKAPAIRSFLAGLIDGKSVTKPKPLLRVVA